MSSIHADNRTYADNSLTIGKTPLVELNRVSEG